jgi:predicted enzyme related to lactoylglutathione lyase
MKTNPVGWFDHVDDMARVKEFYEAVPGVTLEKLEDPNASGIEMLAFPSAMEAYGAAGALVKMEGVKAGGNVLWFITHALTVRSRKQGLLPTGERFSPRK